MTVTAADLARRLGMAGEPTDPAAAADLTRVLDEAVDMLEKRVIVPVEDRSPGEVAVVDEATLQVAAEEWRRRNAPGGVYQMGDGTEQPVRLSYDPLAVVWPKLQRAKLVRLHVGRPPAPPPDPV